MLIPDSLAASRNREVHLVILRREQLAPAKPGAPAPHKPNRIWDTGPVRPCDRRVDAMSLKAPNRVATATMM